MKRVILKSKLTKKIILEDVPIDTPIFAKLRGGWVGMVDLNDKGWGLKVGNGDVHATKYCQSRDECIKNISNLASKNEDRIEFFAGHNRLEYKFDNEKMKKIIVNFEPETTADLDSIEINEPIFVKLDGKLFGMVTSNLEGGEWRVNCGGCSSYSGFHSTRRECMNDTIRASNGKMEFFIEE